MHIRQTVTQGTEELQSQNPSSNINFTTLRRCPFNPRLLSRAEHEDRIYEGWRLHSRSKRQHDRRRPAMLDSVVTFFSPKVKCSQQGPAGKRTRDPRDFPRPCFESHWLSKYKVNCGDVWLVHVTRHKGNAQSPTRKSFLRTVAEPIQKFPACSLTKK